MSFAELLRINELLEQNLIRGKHTIIVNYYIPLNNGIYRWFCLMLYTFYVFYIFFG